jgi:hypothetical protein
VPSLPDEAVVVVADVGPPPGRPGDTRVFRARTSGSRAEVYLSSGTFGSVLARSGAVPAGERALVVAPGRSDRSITTRQARDLAASLRTEGVAGDVYLPAAVVVGSEIAVAEPAARGRLEVNVLDPAGVGRGKKLARSELAPRALDEVVPPGWRVVEYLGVRAPEPGLLRDALAGAVGGLLRYSGRAWVASHGLPEGGGQVVVADVRVADERSTTFWLNTNDAAQQVFVGAKVFGSALVGAGLVELDRPVTVVLGEREQAIRPSAARALATTLQGLGLTGDLYLPGGQLAHPSPPRLPDALHVSVVDPDGRASRTRIPLATVVRRAVPGDALPDGMPAATYLGVAEPEPGHLRDSLVGSAGYLRYSANGEAPVGLLPADAVAVVADLWPVGQTPANPWLAFRVATTGRRPVVAISGDRLGSLLVRLDALSPDAGAVVLVPARSGRRIPSSQARELARSLARHGRPAQVYVPTGQIDGGQATPAPVTFPATAVDPDGRPRSLRAGVSEVALRSLGPGVVPDDLAAAGWVAAGYLGIRSPDPTYLRDSLSDDFIGFMRYSTAGQERVGSLPVDPTPVGALVVADVRPAREDAGGTEPVFWVRLADGRGEVYVEAAVFGRLLAGGGVVDLAGGGPRAVVVALGRAGHPVSAAQAGDLALSLRDKGFTGSVYLPAGQVSDAATVPAGSDVDPLNSDLSDADPPDVDLSDADPPDVDLSDADPPDVDLLDADLWDVRTGGSGVFEVASDAAGGPDGVRERVDRAAVSSWALTGQQQNEVAGRGLLPLDVPADGDCFFAAVARTAVDRGVGGGTDAHTLRQRVAARVRDEWVTGAGYGAFVTAGPGPLAGRSAAQAHELIATAGEYVDEVFDVVVPAAAHELGVRIDVLAPTGVVTLGPVASGGAAGSAPVGLVALEVLYVGQGPGQGPNHYLATSRIEPQFDLGLLDEPLGLVDDGLLSESLAGGSAEPELGLGLLDQAFGLLGETPAPDVEVVEPVVAEPVVGEPVVGEPVVAPGPELDAVQLGWPQAQPAGFEVIRYAGVAEPDLGHVRAQLDAGYGFSPVPAGDGSSRVLALPNGAHGPPVVVLLDTGGLGPTEPPFRLTLRSGRRRRVAMDADALGRALIADELVPSGSSSQGRAVLIVTARPGQSITPAQAGAVVDSLRGRGFAGEAYLPAPEGVQPVAERVAERVAELIVAPRPLSISTVGPKGSVSATLVPGTLGGRPLFETTGVLSADVQVGAYWGELAGDPAHVRAALTAEAGYLRHDTGAEPSVVASLPATQAGLPGPLVVALDVASRPGGSGEQVFRLRVNTTAPRVLLVSGGTLGRLLSAEGPLTAGQDAPSSVLLMTARPRRVITGSQMAGLVKGLRKAGYSGEVYFPVDHLASWTPGVRTPRVTGRALPTMVAEEAGGLVARNVLRRTVRVRDVPVDLHDPMVRAAAPRDLGAWPPDLSYVHASMGVEAGYLVFSGAGDPASELASTGVPVHEAPLDESGWIESDVLVLDVVSPESGDGTHVFRLESSTPSASAEVLVRGAVLGAWLVESGLVLPGGPQASSSVLLVVGRPGRSVPSAQVGELVVAMRQAGFTGPVYLPAAHVAGHDVGPHVAAGGSMSAPDPGVHWHDRSPSSPRPTRLTTRPGPGLVGWTPHGSVTFARDQVRSVAMADVAGRPVGLFYPTGAYDGHRMVSWAAEPIIELDHAYQATDPLGRAHLATAPWSPQGRRGSRPFYVMAHGTPESFGVYVSAVGPSRPQVDQVVEVDGTAYGEILAADPEFRTMTRADPARPVVLLSCATGSPWGNAAARATQALRGAGHFGSVYAPAGISWASHGTGVARYGVLPGQTADGWLVPGVFREMSGSPEPIPEPIPQSIPQSIPEPTPAPGLDDGAGPVGDLAPAAPAVDARRVWSVALTAPSGLALGLSYHPAGSPLHDRALAWAGAVDRILDHSYVSTSFSVATSDRPSLVEASRPAPWAGRVPFYVHVPAAPAWFGIEAAITGFDTAAGPQLVRVDGVGFAGVVVTNLDFAAALGDEPDRPVVLLAPDAANPVGRAAGAFAEALHEMGYLVDVYAPTGPGIPLVGSPGEVAGYIVDPDGMLLEPGSFRLFPSPQREEAGGRPVPGETQGPPGGHVRGSGGGPSPLGSEVAALTDVPDASGQIEFDAGQAQAVELGGGPGHGGSRVADILRGRSSARTVGEQPPAPEDADLTEGTAAEPGRAGPSTPAS